MVYGKLLAEVYFRLDKAMQAFFRRVKAGEKPGFKKQEEETPKERKKRRLRNRMVYNDWGLYGFVQMLTYKCLRFGKELHIISERDTTKTCHVCQQKQAMPLWKRVYRCSNENCGLVMDRDENSAVSIYERFLAGPPPHTSAI